MTEAHGTVLSAALVDLRLAGLAAVDLDDRSFEVRAKGRELARLLAAYERRMGEQGLADYASALRLARERVRTDAAAVSERAIVIIPEDADLTGLERALWEEIPAQRRAVLPVDPPAARSPGWSSRSGMPEAGRSPAARSARSWRAART